MYRPQFVYETPEGFEDEPFEYWFDSHNVPALGVSLTSGQQLLNVPLPTQPDADFFWRAIKITASNNKFYIRFRDGFGNYLSEFIPGSNYIPSPTPAEAPIGGTPVVLEPEVPCPAGTILYVDIAVP